MTDFSRRKFLKGTAVAGAVAAAVSVVGCSSESATTSVADIKWDDETDVVIVGSGLAGMAAGIVVATEGNGATCTILEKGKDVMGDGNSKYSSGYVLYGTDLDATTSYFKQMRGEYTGTPDAVIESFAQGICDNYDWLTSLGIEEADMVEGLKPGEWTPEYSSMSDSDKVGFVLLKTDNSGDKSHIVRYISSQLDQHEDVVTRLSESPMTALVQDPETKAILGVIYTTADGDVALKANKGVIMTCGGFENNDIMRQDYLSQPTCHAIAGNGNTGDGHKACMAIGADFWHMNGCAGFWNTGVSLDGKKFENIYLPGTKEHGITVGKNGRRYYMDWDGCTTYVHGAEGDDMSLLVGSRHGHMQYGGDWMHLTLPSESWYIFDQDGLEAGAISKGGVKDVVEDGFGYSSDTIEGLAEQMEVPVDELVRTVSVWNGYVEQGVDLSFYRPADKSAAIANPPYYAMKQIPTYLNTDGGPRRDENGQIIGVDGAPIPNLYSAGEFGSVWADKYQGGGNLGECCAFGRISARSVLGA